MHLPKGLGTHDEACSIACINLALTRKLTDTIPDCMSLTIGKWIIGTQDAMPDEMRNSQEWKALLPLAAGTGRDPYAENARRILILDWMWKIVLPQLQPIADKYNFGVQWKKMTNEKTTDAAYAAAGAYIAGAYAAASAYAAADAAGAAADAADAAGAGANAANAAANAAAYAAANAAYWEKVNPCKLLKALIEI